LRLLFGNAILGHEFDSVRSYVSGGEETERVSVEHLTSRKYRPFHHLRVFTNDSTTTIEVVFFWWLVYEVCFHHIAYGGPDFVYIEDLAGKRGLLARSWKEAMEGEFYEL